MSRRMPASGVAPGIDAVIRVPELPDRPFPGKVTRIADALQPGTRTLLVEIDIANPDGLLSPGIYCTAELHIPRKTASVTVPAGAIIFNRDGVQVAVVEDGVAHLRKISITRDRGTEVEVRGWRQSRRPRDPQSRRRAFRRRSGRDPHMTLSRGVNFPPRFTPPRRAASLPPQPPGAPSSGLTCRDCGSSCSSPPAAIHAALPHLVDRSRP